MKMIFPVLLMLIAIANGLVTFALGFGSVHARIRIAVRYETLFNTKTLPIQAQKENHVTQEDLQICPKKVQSDYEALAKDAFSIGNPEKRWPMYLSFLASCCLFVSGILLFKPNTRIERWFQQGQSG